MNPVLWKHDESFVYSVEQVCVLNHQLRDSALQLSNVGYCH